MATTESFHVTFMARTAPLRRALGRVTKDLKKFGTRVAKFGAAAGLAVVTTGAVAATKAVDDLGKSADIARKLGEEGIFNAQVIRDFAAEYGVAADTVRELVTEIQRKVGEGDNDLLRQAGIEPSKIRTAKSSIDILRIALKGLAKLKTPDFLAAVGSIAGDEVSSELQRIFKDAQPTRNIYGGRVAPRNNPAARLDQIMARLRASPTRPDATVTQIDQLRNTFKGLSDAVLGITAQLVLGFSPHLFKLTNFLAGWLNNEQNLKSVVEGTVAAFQTLNEWVAYTVDLLGQWNEGLKAWDPLGVVKPITESSMGFIPPEQLKAMQDKPIEVSPEAMALWDSMVTYLSGIHKKILAPGFQ